MQLDTGRGLISRIEVDRIHGDASVLSQMCNGKLVNPIPTTAATVTPAIAAIIDSLSEVMLAVATEQPRELHEDGLGVINLLRIGMRYIAEFCSTSEDHKKQQQAALLRPAYSNCSCNIWLQYLVSLCCAMFDIRFAPWQ